MEHSTQISPEDREKRAKLVALHGEELVTLHEKFREIKHSINNSLAVLMALSELAQRNSAQYEKLGKTVLIRGPDIVNQLQDFQAAIFAKRKGDAPPPPPSA